MGAKLYEIWHTAKEEDIRGRTLSLARNILGVTQSTPREVMLSRWRILARLSHPDQSDGTSYAKKMFQTIAVAKDVLLEDDASWNRAS